jgi:hypothetical protein
LKSRIKSPQLVVHLPSFYGMKSACSRHLNAKHSALDECESIELEASKSCAQGQLFEVRNIPLIVVVNSSEIIDQLRKVSSFINEQNAHSLFKRFISDIKSLNGT